MSILAIDIGGTKTAAAIVAGGEILEYRTWQTPREAGATAVLASVIENCRDLSADVDGCGVSFGGPFDFPTQTCVRSMHVSGWDDVELSVRLHQALGIPVVTDNDANVAALGEYASALRALPGTGVDPMLYVTVSTGVGAAIVTGGELLRGAHSLAGELGHLPIGHDKACGCGQVGCLERAVSGYWIEQDHGLAAVDYLSDEARHAAWIDQLVRGLWSATLLIDPAMIVIGGGMTAQGRRMSDPLESALARMAASSSRPAPKLRVGDPSGRTVLLGAAMLVETTIGTERRGSR